MDLIAEAPNLMFGRANLIEVVPTANTGHIVLQTIDPDSGPRQRLRKPGAAGLYPLTGLTADLDRHVVDHGHPNASPGRLPILPPSGSVGDRDVERRAFRLRLAR